MSDGARRLAAAKAADIGSMFDDLFNFFRYVLAIIVTIYATVVTLQSLLGWYVYLAGGDKYASLLRRYLIVHGLRLRFRAFWGDVIICGLLCVVFLILWHAHGKIYDIDNKLKASRIAGAAAPHAQAGNGRAP